MLKRVKSIIIPIIDVEVFVIIGDPKSVETYIQDLHHQRFEISSPNVVAETFYSDDSDADEYLYIALYDITDIKDSAYNIIHECLHAAHKALDFRGISHDEELLCYLQGFLIDKVLECLNAELMVVTNHLPTVEDTQL